MELVSQLAMNGLLNGGLYALIGMSWGLIFGTTGVKHFAYGPIYTMGAFVMWWLIEVIRWPIGAAIPLGIVATVVAGVLSYVVVYRPFVVGKESIVVILIASIGLGIIIDNLVLLLFGTDNKVVGNVSLPVFLVGTTVVTGAQLLQLVAFILVAALLSLFLKFTRSGQAILAMTDNPEMAEIVGINTYRTSLSVFAIGSAISAIAASLVLLRDGATIHMGFNAIFTAFLAVITGGVGSIWGAATAGFALGMVESVGMWKIPSEWQSSISFLMLFIILLVRPQGLFGGRK